MGVLLYFGGHTHSHGTTGRNSPDAGEQPNINVRAAMIHVLGDLIQSVGVLVAALLIFFNVNLSFAIRLFQLNLHSTTIPFPYMNKCVDIGLCINMFLFRSVWKFQLGNIRVEVTKIDKYIYVLCIIE